MNYTKKCFQKWKKIFVVVHLFEEFFRRKLEEKYLFFARFNYRISRMRIIFRIILCKPEFHYSYVFQEKKRVSLSHEMCAAIIRAQVRVKSCGAKNVTVIVFMCQITAFILQRIYRRCKYYNTWKRNENMKERMSKYGRKGRKKRKKRMKYFYDFSDIYIQKSLTS